LEKKSEKREIWCKIKITMNNVYIKTKSGCVEGVAQFLNATGVSITKIVGNVIEASIPNLLLGHLKGHEGVETVGYINPDVVEIPVPFSKITTSFVKTSK
jgi:hypothetical protein